MSPHAEAGRQTYGLRLASRLAFLIADNKAGGPFPFRIKGRVLHAERIQDACLHECIKGLAAGDLHDARRHIDAGLGVLPFRAGFVLHGRGQEQRHQLGQRMSLAYGRGVPFPKTGGVCEGLGDGQVGRLAGRRLKIGKGGNVLCDRVRDVELAFILQHQNGDCRDRLRHRGDPEHRIWAHRRFRGKVSQPHRFEVHHLVFGDDDSDRAGTVVSGDV